MKITSRVRKCAQKAFIELKVRHPHRKLYRNESIQIVGTPHSDSATGGAISVINSNGALVRIMVPFAISKDSSTEDTVDNHLRISSLLQTDAYINEFFPLIVFGEGSSFMDTEELRYVKARVGNFNKVNCLIPEGFNIGINRVFPMSLFLGTNEQFTEEYITAKMVEMAERCLHVLDK